MSPGRLVAILALAATMTVITPARAARTWLPPVQLAPPTATPSEGADVAMDAAGNALAVWVRGSGEAAFLQGSTRSVGGAWSAPRELSTPGRDARDLRVRMNARGDALVVWTENGQDGRVVRYRSRPAGGDFGVQITLSEAGAWGPDVSVNATGAAVATWERNDAVEAATRAADDDRFGLPRVISRTAGAGLPRTGIDDAGNAVVAWQQLGGNSSYGESNAFSAGRWTGAETIPGSQIFYGAPAVAMHPSGRAVVAFHGRLAPTQFLHLIRVASRASAAAPWGEAQPFSNHEVPHGLQARFDRDGTPLFFMGGGRISNGWQLYGGPMPGGAVELQGPDFIEDPPWGVATSSAGGTVLYWAGTDRAYQARHRPPGGAFGPIETIGGRGAGESGLALDDEGNGALVWQDRATGAIWATELDAGPPTISELAVPERAMVDEPVTMRVAAADRLTAVGAAWRFSDGRTADGAQVTRTFTLPGVYEITAIARDAGGNETRATRTITITAPAPAPPEPDGDGDGVRVSLDCDDANAAVFPGAAERVGNAVDENCDGRSDPYPTVAATAQLTSQFQRDRSTRLLALTISDAAAGDTVRVTCRGKGCRKGLARTLPVTRDQRALKLAKVAGARLRPKAVLEVMISHPDRVARIFTFTMRSKAKPAGPAKLRRCQAPDQARAVPC